MNSKYTGALGEGESASEYEQDMNNRAGFHLGVVMDWNVARNFYIQPGLYFTTHGAKLEDGETYNGESYSYTENGTPTTSRFRSWPLTAFRWAKK